MPEPEVRPCDEVAALEAAEAGVRPRAASAAGSWRAQSGGESGIADEIAKHQNVGCLGAVVDGRDCLGERLAGNFAGAGGLGKCERGAVRSEPRRLLAAALFFDPEVPMKWASPSSSQAGGDFVEVRIQACVRAWARILSSASGVAWRMAVTRSEPVSKGASSGSGRSRMVSWERGDWPSQP